MSSLRPVISEFTNNSEYDYFIKVTASKDHIKKHCRTCQFHWRERTLDDPLNGEPK